MMNIKYGYVGSTEVSKIILKNSNIDPDIIISYSEKKRDDISGFTTYEEYKDKWFTVDTINGTKAKKIFEENKIDILLVMACQEIIKSEILSLPKIGCIGRHLALLPKRRGRAPVAWALIQGLEKTGVTLFWLDEGIDSGDIISQKEVPIDFEDEASDLHDKLTSATVDLVDELIPKLEYGIFPRKTQDESKATYTHPRRPDMGLIDWNRESHSLYNFIRGQNHPYPGAFTYHKMDKIIVWHSKIYDDDYGNGVPGEVLKVIDDNKYLVQTGDGVLEITIEKVNDKYNIEKGSKLGCLY